MSPTWLRCAFLGSTHTDVQAYPPPSYPPTQPNHCISEESGIPLPEDPITSQKTRKQGVLVSLHSSRRPTDMREATKRRFMCKECPKSYAQQQGLNRHYGKKHNPNLCKCCKFEWIRPYEYRAHLEKCHRNENPDEVLGKPAKSHRRTAAFVGRRPQHDLPPISGYDGQGHSENRPYPPAVAESSTITPHPHPHSMNYVPQPESMQVNESSPEGTVDRFMLQALPAVV